MVNQLNRLVSGKLRRPLIINGKLVVMHNAIVTVRRENYHVVFSCRGRSGEETMIDDGDSLLDQYATEFNTRYEVTSTRDREAMTKFTASVDPFTGAIVLKNGLYERLLDRYDELHFHDGTRQFMQTTQDTITDFVKQLSLDYFEIFRVLLSRRLMASHMPIKIKGHLVAGLFQPLTIATKYIDCPFTLGEFAWMTQLLNSPEVLTERLEGVSETSRGLEITVIAMSDFSSKFGVPCPKELNRIYFQFCLYTMLLEALVPGGGSAMSQGYPRVYRQIEEGVGDGAVAGPFLLACLESLNKMRTRLVVR